MMIDNSSYEKPKKKLKAKTIINLSTFNEKNIKDFVYSLLIK